MAGVRYDNYQTDEDKAAYAKKHPSTKVPPRPPRWVFGRIGQDREGEVVEMVTTHLYPGDELNEKQQTEVDSLNSLATHTANNHKGSGHIPIGKQVI